MIARAFMTTDLLLLNFVQTINVQRKNDRWLTVYDTGSATVE